MPDAWLHKKQQSLASLGSQTFECGQKPVNEWQSQSFGDEDELSETSFEAGPVSIFGCSSNGKPLHT